MVPIASQCFAQGDVGFGLTDVQARLDPDVFDIVSSIPNRAALFADTAWPVSEPFAVAAP